MARNSPSQRPVWQGWAFRPAWLGGAPREDGGARGLWLPSSAQVSAHRTGRCLADLEPPPAGPLTPRPLALAAPAEPHRDMPRARKGSAPRKSGQRRRAGARSSAQADSGSSEDEAASEACSTTSECPSLLSTAAEDNLGGDAVDEQGQQEDLEEKLKECVDCLTDKSAKTRQGALGNLRLTLASHLLPDFLLERSLTLTDALEKCLKKGKGEEQALAAAVLGLLCVQLGPGPKGEELFHSLKPLLVSVLSDSTASPAARLHCASALGLGCYVAADDVQDLVSCLSCLEGVFSRCCGQGSPAAPAVPASLHGLLCAALQAWALLLTICPSTHISQILERQLPRLPQLLSSDSVNLRMAAGETIALLFELARDLEEDFVYEDLETLCGALRTLATDSNKYRAKADRRRQRSTFRAVLHFVEGGECEEETVRFGLEVLYVDSWARRRVYAAFRDVLGSGMHHHLQNNELLRDVFGLGPVLVLDATALKACKISRFEKHLYNAAAFRARTKARGRMRDKRADVL
ncbi:PREDICTED: LOW QUALITY PROTEIN: interferon-related developmental regulator 2 [Condylura cristata]|uniref:LOW QUALITY PROTEIN: interferon-related developmental regulator 2 n=1 Tax=Condylura cristata TaxID=143302 RepID=UPI0003343FCF|nr:PREDICTED: LOW QUALITY PROTEIN: interferon-related developmental regulator 2 [Condylura cristata]